MATLTFFKYDRVIRVDAPQTEVTVQDLVNEIRRYEHQLINLDYGHICNAYGKQPLGGGAYVGITLELINNWRIQFEPRTSEPTITCYIKGGNVVAINDYENNPIKPADYVTVIIAQSTSPSIIQAESDYGMLYLLESMRGSHKSIGSIYYWNPNGGNDSNSGTTPATAVETFDRAHYLAADGKGDIIFALSTQAAGTTSSEILTITKNNLKVRGPGYPFSLTGTQGSPTVTISGNDVEFSGFYVTTAGSGTDNAIAVTGDNTLILDCWIEGATGNGIDISSSTRTQIDTCAIENCDGNGINIGASTTSSTIRKCIITGNADGVDLSGSSISDNILENNIIYNNTANGIFIDNGVTRTGIRLHHTFAGNATNINDTGTGTFQDISGTITEGDIAAIVDGVWDEVISTTVHAGAGSAGKTLRDAKTKATLASLK